MAKIDITESMEKTRRQREIRDIEVNGEKIKVPNFISMRAIVEYEKEYEETKDSRKSFSKLLTKVINKFENQQIIFDFNDLNDNMLIDLMEFLIKDDEYYEPFFEENNLEYTFDNFYKAYNYKRRELSEMFSSALKPQMDGMLKITEGLFKPIKGMQNSLSSMGGFSNLYKGINIYPQMSLVEKYVSPIEKVVLNKEINRNLEIKSPVEIGNEIIDISRKQLELMAKEHNDRKKAERDALKRDNINFWIAIISLVIALLSFMGIDNILILLNIK